VKGTASGAHSGRSLRRVGTALVFVALVGLVGHEFRPRLWRWYEERHLPRGERPNVLLLTLDSTRADRLGSYGHPGDATPHLDGLAAEGVLFEQAYTQVPLCLAAHATILTGALPGTNGIHTEGDRLREGQATLAESLRAAGYATAAFVSSSALDHSSGLDRGFEAFDDDFGPPGKIPGQQERRTATETVDRALAWVAKAGPRPLFLWLHLDDARPPHYPLEEFRRRFPGEPYMAEIAFVDAEVGRLLRELRRTRPDLLVIAIGDHGSALGEHGEESHGRFLYSSTTRVPFLMAMPGRLPRGVRVRAVVRTMDLVPTLLDVLGLTTPSGGEGVSLVPFILREEGLGPGAAPMENLAPHRLYGFSPLYGVRSGPYLFVRGARRELYDSQQDPGEANDIASRLPRMVGSLDRKMAGFFPELPPLTGDPVQEEEIYRRYRAAVETEERGSRAAAIELYREILSEWSGLALARRRLGDALLREGRLEESAQVLRESIDRHEAVDATYLNLALVRYRLGDSEEALDSLRRGVQAFPCSPRLWYRLGWLLREQGRIQEAAEALRQAVGLEPRFLDAQLALARAWVGCGRRTDAEDRYRGILEMAPGSEQAAEATKEISLLADASPPP
jgi:arylsulfatase A-like enzyme/Tfp pilus assembly protein PilF